MIESLRIPAPQRVSDQWRIAETLGALDDKIELNRRMSETLEAMARAIFQDWFVDFGPTRAKMEGHEPYLAPEIWALFPDALVDSEIGRLPSGWSQERLDEVLELSYGKALRARDRVPGSVPVYGSGGITGYHNVALVEGPSVIVGRKGTVGSLYWEGEPFHPIDTVFYVNPKDGVPLTYCYYLLQNLGLRDMNTDAAVPGLNRNNAYRLTFPWGPSELLKQFDSIVSGLRDKIQLHKDESRTLAKLRDLLLPKLMSGEIRVGEADALMESVG